MLFESSNDISKCVADREAAMLNAAVLPAGVLRNYFAAILLHSGPPLRSVELVTSLLHFAFSTSADRAAQIG
jgi:hypothetical protein